MLFDKEIREYHIEKKFSKNTIDKRHEKHANFATFFSSNYAYFSVFCWFWIEQLEALMFTNETKWHLYNKYFFQLTESMIFLWKPWRSLFPWKLFHRQASKIIWKCQRHQHPTSEQFWPANEKKCFCKNWKDWSSNRDGRNADDGWATRFLKIFRDIFLTHSGRFIQARLSAN